MSNNLYYYLEIIVPIVGFVLLLIAFFVYERLTREKRAIKRRLQKLPVHAAILANMETAQLLTTIAGNLSSVQDQDYYGRTAMRVLLDLETKAEDCIVLALMNVSMPFDVVSGQPRENHGDGWALLVQQDRYASIVDQILDDHSKYNTLLTSATDCNGRSVMNIASPKCRNALEQSTYFLKRFKIYNLSVPQHQSATCVLFIAADHTVQGKPVDVALKFMKHEKEWKREIDQRSKGNFSNEFVVGVLDAYSYDNNDKLASNLHKYQLEEYPYCLVMPAGSRNLNDIINSERVTGNIDKVRFIALQIGQCLEHMHSKAVIHGDIKTKNILRMGDSIMLIDLDASAVVGSGHAGAKYSSAYSPPELLFMNEYGKPEIKTFAVDVTTGLPLIEGLPYSLVVAHPAHDVWAFGVTLFHLFAGEPLFLSNSDDNIDRDQLLMLYECSDLWREVKLEKIEEPKARNLVSQLLVKNPASRPHMSMVLQHPFFTGRYTSPIVFIYCA